MDNAVRAMNTWARTILAALLGALLIGGTAGDAVAASATEIDREVAALMKQMQAEEPDTRAAFEKAVAVLVFPDVLKGAVIVGGLYGEGALLIKGQTRGYYSSAAASIGL